tara:strand:+ start:1229 stop:1471 length:243 start_codon:yes stop_codon:yes gene_type:complete
MITTVLAMACMVWLIGENRAYKAQYKKQLIREAELVDQMFDMQIDNARYLDLIYGFETENAILGSCCANGGTYPGEESND